MKHHYLIDGIDTNGNKFTSICVSDSIINALNMYKDRGYSVYSMQKLEQVSLNTEIGITNLVLYS